MSMRRICPRLFGLALLGTALLATSAQATMRNVTVTIENLGPTNGVTFSPLRVGFHSGVFDAFDEGSAASAAIISIAEGGSGSDWFPAFAAADPTAVTGSVVNAGPAIPAGNVGDGGNTFNSTATNTFQIDTDVNPFFTFANMVVPSNDLFLGNDNPIQLFDNSGNLLLSEITLTGASIWNAGSEQAIVANGAFTVGSTNSDRVDENGVVEFSLSELSVFDGVTTPANYVFDSSLITGNTEIYRISFSSAPVPEPSSLALVALCGLGGGYGLFRRRRG